MGVESRIGLPSVEAAESWLGKKSAGLERIKVVLCLCIVFYVVVFSILTILRHYAFKTQAWDLGIFTQSFWTTLNGKGLFYHTCELIIHPSGSFFGVHFSPVLFLILPLYWLLPTSETLLVLQSLVLALAAIPICKLAKENLGGKFYGLVFAIAYLVYPATQTVNLYDFHVQAFLPLFLAFTIYYVFKESWAKYFLFMFLALMVEEHAAQVFFFVGIYIAWKYRVSIVSAARTRKYLEPKLLISIVTIMISIIWYWFTIWQRDTFFPVNPATLDMFLSGDNFKILGARNPLEIPLLVVLRPLNAMQALAYDGGLKLLYLIVVFGPLAFFSLRSPFALLPTLPWFGFSLLSQAAAHHMLGFHYESYIVSFVFVAAILALGKRPLRNVKSSLRVMIVFSVIFFFMVSPLSPISVSSSGSVVANVGAHELLLNQIVAMVPPNASILTQNNIFPHMSNRLDAYVVPDPWLNTAIHDIVVDFVNQTISKVEYVLIDSETDSTAAFLVLSLLQTRAEFTLTVSQDGGTILLYKRMSNG